MLFSRQVGMIFFFLVRKLICTTNEIKLNFMDIYKHLPIFKKKKYYLQVLEQCNQNLYTNQIRLNYTKPIVPKIPFLFL